MLSKISQNSQEFTFCAIFKNIFLWHTSGGCFCTSRHSDPFHSKFRAKLNWAYCQPLKATRKGKKIAKISVSLKNVRRTLFGVFRLKKESTIFKNTWNRFFLVIIWLKVTFIFSIITFKSISSNNFFSLTHSHPTFLEKSSENRSTFAVHIDAKMRPILLKI